MVRGTLWFLIVSCLLVGLVFLYAGHNRQQQRQIYLSLQQREGEDYYSDTDNNIQQQRGLQRQQQPLDNRIVEDREFAGGGGTKGGEGEGEREGDLSCQVGDEVQCISRILECFGPCIQSGSHCARCIAFTDSARGSEGRGSGAARGGSGRGETERLRERERVWGRCCPCLSQILGPGWGWECPASLPATTTPTTSSSTPLSYDPIHILPAAAKILTTDTTDTTTTTTQQ